MNSNELKDLIKYANALGATNAERKAKVQEMLENASSDELRDLDMNTLVWLLDGLEKAERGGQRNPLNREHLIYRSHDHNRAEIKPQVTLRNRHLRGINAGSESTSNEVDSNDDLPETQEELGTLES